MTLFLLLALVACDTTVAPTFDQCELAGVLSAEHAAPGDTVVLAARPLTDDRDTLVTVGPTTVDATVDRAGCEACDVCVSDSGCDACGACTACQAACESCVETATFVVPEAEPGDAQVILTNAWGSTPPLPLTIDAPGDGS